MSSGNMITIEYSISEIPGGSRTETKHLPNTSEEARVRWAKKRIKEVLQEGIYCFTDANKVLFWYPPSRIYQCAIILDEKKKQ